MKKLALCGVAGLAVLFLAGCDNSSQINQPQNQSQTSQTQTTNQQANDFDLQTKCATQADKFFKQYTGNSPSGATYTDHWNKSLGKCFIEIVDLNMYSKDLNDAIEGKSYGTFIHPLNSKPLPDSCQISKDGSSANMQKCNSEADFDNFVQPYMNN